MWANAHETREIKPIAVPFHAKLIYKYQILYLDHKR